MTQVDLPHTEFSIRAPRGHGESVCIPQGPGVSTMWHENALVLQQASMGDWGEDLQELRDLARSEALKAATAYTSQYRDVDPASCGKAIVGSGHQPQLFHPGVWFKNFALHSVAKQLQATALNVIIDNDVCQTTSIKAPSGPATSPHLEVVAFDQSREGVPFETRQVVDEEAFFSFPRRVGHALSGRVADPLVEEWWRGAREVGKWSSNLGQRVAALRHQLEGKWGLETLEVPLSRLCQTESFCRFAAVLLGHPGRIQAVYNSALCDYRKANRVRSRSHPVPALETNGPWVEAPFWVYSKQGGARRRLYVRIRGHEVHLGDLVGWEAIIPRRQLASWLRMQDVDEVIRPRALMTTCFLRLILSQMFLHGIGGAKYDQLTDQIINRLWGFQPPGYMTLTATLQLPLEKPNAVPQDIPRLKQAVRDLIYHPEDHLDPNHSEHHRQLEWAAEKSRWIGRPCADYHELRVRHRAIETANLALNSNLSGKRRELEQELEQVRREVRLSQLLGSREFSVCLFPKDMLRQELMRLTAGLSLS